jgi:hypothetical protein
VGPIRPALLLLAAAAAALLTLAACGNGDDTTSVVPFPDAGHADATMAPEACVPDGGSSARCNSCTTPASDPYNACSAFTGGCIAFDAARVPSHPTF